MTVTIEAIREAILKADSIVASPQWNAEQGLSGTKVLSLLSNLAKCALDDPSKCYVEIGIYRGLTLGKVASSAPQSKAIGIDNFSQFDPRGENERYVRKHLSEVAPANALLVNADYEQALATLGDQLTGKKVGLYFIDGPHDYRSQLMCLLLARRWLADDAVIVIDDCNYEHVRLATRDLLSTDSSFSLVMQAYTPQHPETGTEANLENARRGWWNGIHVLLKHPPEIMLPSLPVPVGSARARCEADHYLHAHRFFSELDKLTNLADLAVSRPIWHFLKRAFDVRRLLLRAGKQGLVRGPNTYSADLPRFEIIGSE